MTYKLHANFATVKSFQALSCKEKDGLCNETVSTGFDILSRPTVSSASRTHLKTWMNSVGWGECVGCVTLSSKWWCRQWEPDCPCSANCVGSFFKQESTSCWASSQLVFKPVSHRRSQPVNLPVGASGRGESIIVAFLSPTPSIDAHNFRPGPLWCLLLLCHSVPISHQKRSLWIWVLDPYLSHFPYSVAVSTVLLFWPWILTQWS